VIGTGVAIGDGLGDPGDGDEGDGAIPSADPHAVVATNSTSAITDHLIALTYVERKPAGAETANLFTARDEGGPTPC
jgi:hypothetical protein